MFQVMSLLQILLYAAASQIEGWSPSSAVPKKLDNRPVSEELKV